MAHRSSAASSACPRGLFSHLARQAGVKTRTTWWTYTAYWRERSRWRHETRGREQSFVQSRAPAASRPERARGGCTNACKTPAHCSRSLKAQASRVPGICERFNGLRDPSMTLALTWRRDYAQIVTHPGPPLEFCDYPHAPARFTLPQSLLRECPAAPSAPGSEASVAAVARPHACV